MHRPTPIPTILPSDVERFCAQHQMSAEQFYGHKTYDKTLPETIEELPEGFSAKLPSLYLPLLTSLPEGYNVEASGGISLENLK